MLTGSRTESGTPILSAQMRNTIQSIKEIVKDHSDAEIYVALKESNMDPNETAQKLLLQDPFHEVKSKRDKKKESMGYKGSEAPRKFAETSDRGVKYNKFPDLNAETSDRGVKYNKFPDPDAENSDRGTNYTKFPDRNTDPSVQGTKYNKFPDRNADAVKGSKYNNFPDRNADAVQRSKYNNFPDRNADPVQRSKYNNFPDRNAGHGVKNYKFPGQNSENTGHQMTYNKYPDRNAESSSQGMKYNAFPDRTLRRGGYTRNPFPDAGVTRKFRVVRDNRPNQNTNREVNPPSPQTSTEGELVLNTSEKGTTSTSVYQKDLDGQNRLKPSIGSNGLQPRQARDASSSGTNRQEVLEEKQTTVSSSVPRTQAGYPNKSQPNPTTSATSNSVVGLYSSSTDPVHVPSPDSRSSAGVVGVRCQPSEKIVKHLSLSNSAVGRVESTESFRHAQGESIIPSISNRLPSNNNQYNSRQHQAVGHQKALQPNKEWKPKSSQKASVVNPGPGVIGTPTKSSSPQADNSENLKSISAKLQDKNTLVNTHENQNVIIAQHIRVPETDRCRLTFGSFGLEFDNSRNFVSGGGTDDIIGEPAESLSESATQSSTDDASGSKHADLLDDQARNSGSDSSEHRSVDKKESSSPQNIENYADIGLVRDHSPSYASSVSQQQSDHPELPSFSAYDPQTGYEMPYFRSTMDESARGQGFPSHQEALNSNPASTIAMVQQQQPHPQQVAQMYPQQVHVSHYANLMPYRQFISPVYAPPMGYSNNPAYPHPPNGNNYLLMPGGGSQFNAGMKFGIQPFKPVPAGSSTGYGNFPNPSGYAINATGVVGSATGLEDSSRIKFKDGNHLYVPNPQAETSEMWIQNPRDIAGMQSAQYYNIPGQSPHAAAYMPSHTFNPGVAAQSSHMQYQGMYQQPAAMGNPHHLGPAIGVGGNVPQTGPGAQVGPYQQQPQMGHLNWTTNF